MIGAKKLLRVASDAELRARVTAAAAKSGLAVVESSAPLAAVINHGRWIANCPCGAGVACDPELSIAVCLMHRDPDDANAALTAVVHTAIAWPPNRVGIEHSLGKRPLARNQNWLPSESVKDLDDENAAHGVKG